VLESVLGNEMDGDTDEEQAILKKIWNGRFLLLNRRR
jgi:hypothetical protein